MYDKIIHMQRMRLKALLREKDQAEVAAREAVRAQAQQVGHGNDARPASRRGTVSEYADGASVQLLSADAVRKVIPLLKTRRGAMALALGILAILLMYSSQRGVDSSEISRQDQPPGCPSKLPLFQFIS